MRCRRKLKGGAITAPHQEDALPKLRNAIVNGVHYMPACRIVRSGLAVDFEHSPAAIESKCLACGRIEFYGDCSLKASCLKPEIQAAHARIQADKCSLDQYSAPS